MTDLRVPSPACQLDPRDGDAAARVLIGHSYVVPGLSCGKARHDGHECPGAGLGLMASALAVSGADSWPPMSKRKGGYLSVISVAYAPTRYTQRFIPMTKSKML